jgi:hypothetical protein
MDSPPGLPHIQVHGPSIAKISYSSYTIDKLFVAISIHLVSELPFEPWQFCQDNLLSHKALYCSHSYTNGQVIGFFSLASGILTQISSSVQVYCTLCQERPGLVSLLFYKLGMSVSLQYLLVETCSSGGLGGVRMKDELIRP